MSHHSTQSPLPILDWQEYRSPETRPQFLKKLLSAAHEVGFFYLKNHGIDEDLIAQAFQLGKDFFALTDEEKNSIHMVNSPHFRGYSALHDEITRANPDSREQFDYMPELEAYPLESIPADEPWLRLQGPNQWPTQLPQFKSTLLTLQKEQTALAIELVSAFAQALGAQPDAFEHTLNHHPSVLSKVIHYPVLKESIQGVGPHKDAGYVTLLQQDEISGLEVLIDDEWVGAPPIEGTFIINIGELLELASNGFLKATYHRVISPTVGVDRYSLAFFLTSQLDATVPLLDLPAELAKKCSQSNDPHNPLFTQIGKNFLKGRLRSHPEVAARHYPNLTLD